MSITITIRSVIKGYHVYRVKPNIDDELEIRSDPCPADPVAQGIYTKEGKKVGHAPTYGGSHAGLSLCLERARNFSEDVSMKW